MKQGSVGSGRSLSRNEVTISQLLMLLTVTNSGKISLQEFSSFKIKFTFTFFHFDWLSYELPIFASHWSQKKLKIEWF